MLTDLPCPLESCIRLLLASSPLSTVSSGLCDSEAASEEQSAANVFMLLQRGHLERLTQIQISVAPIILSWQEGWTNDLRGLFHLEYL